MPSTITAAWIVAGDPIREEWVGAPLPLPEPEEWVRLMEFQRGEERIAVDVADCPQNTSAVIRFQGTISGTARDLVGQVGYFFHPFDAHRLPIISKALEDWSQVLRGWCYKEITTADAVSKLLGIDPGTAVAPSDDQSVGDAFWLPLPTPPESSRRMWLVGISAAAVGGALGFVFGTKFAQVMPPQLPTDAKAMPGVQPAPKDTTPPQASPVPRFTPTPNAPAKEQQTQEIGGLKKDFPKTTPDD
jgi:hypothetical protein